MSILAGLAGVLLVGLLGLVALMSSSLGGASEERAPVAVHHEGPAEGGAAQARDESAQDAGRRGALAARAPEGSLFPGAHLSYSMQQELAIRMDADGLVGAFGDSGPQTAAASVPVTELKFRGLLDVKVYGEASSGWVVGFTMIDWESSASAEGGLLEKAEGAPVMDREVLAVLAASGRIEKLLLPDELSITEAMHWRGLLARWQVVRPEDPSLSEWTAEEADPTGVFVAQYRALSDGAQTTLQKENLGYVSLQSRSGGRATSTVEVHGMTEIRVDQLPIRADGWEFLQVHTSNDGPALAQVRTDFSFERQSLEFRGDLIAELDRKAEQLSSQACTSLLGEDVAPEALSLTRESLPVEDLLVECELAIRANGIRSSQVAQWMGRLVDRLRHDDEGVAEVMALLREGLQQPELTRLLVGALGSAGTPVAQAGLAEIFSGEEWPLGMRKGALTALVRLESPTAATQASLLSLHAEGGALSSNALLLLGAVAGKGRQADPAGFAEIEAYLQELALSSTTPKEHRLTLAAIGNLGPATLPDLVHAAYADADDVVRSASVWAARSIPDPSATEFIRQALFGDPSEEVRLRALDALVAHPRPGQADAIGEALLTDASESVRLECLQQIVHLEESQLAAIDLEVLLLQVSQNDASLEVSSMATQMLESF